MVDMKPSGLRSMQAESTSIPSRDGEIENRQKFGTRISGEASSRINSKQAQIFKIQNLKLDKSVRSRWRPVSVIPAEAGIQGSR